MEIEYLLMRLTVHILRGPVLMFKEAYINSQRTRSILRLIQLPLFLPT